MPKQLEEGIYLFRIKFENVSGETAVDYQWHEVKDMSSISGILARLDNFYKHVSKGKLDVTYKFAR